VAVVYFGAPNPALSEIDGTGLPQAFLRSREAGAPSSPTGNRGSFFLALSSNILVGGAGRLHFQSALRLNAFVRSPRLRFENAIATIGQTIYVFHIVPTVADAHSGKDITFDELQSCVEEASMGENLKSIVL
jgi:hypothetical protein